MENLLRDIEAFMKVRRMDPTTFGKEAMNNSAFVFRLRDGMDVRMSTVKKVREFMENYDA